MGNPEQFKQHKHTAEMGKVDAMGMH